MLNIANPNSAENLVARLKELSDRLAYQLKELDESMIAQDFFPSDYNQYKIDFASKKIAEYVNLGNVLNNRLRSLDNEEIVVPEMETAKTVLRLVA